jgi:predicted transcriptional regulator
MTETPHEDGQAAAFTIYIPREMKELLRVVAFETRRSQTDIIREALASWLKRWREHRSK